MIYFETFIFYLSQSMVFSQRTLGDAHQLQVLHHYISFKTELLSKATFLRYCQTYGQIHLQT